MTLTYKQPPPPASILADLNNPASASLPDGDAHYQFTKLADVFLASRLGPLSSAEGAVINSVHPGLGISEFRREYRGFPAWVLNTLAWPARKGAKG